MHRIFRRRRVRVLTVAVLLAVVVVAGYGMYLGSLAGRLPWQADPTRVAIGITPFAGIPGLGEPTSAPTPGTPEATPPGALQSTP